MSFYSMLTDTVDIYSLKSEISTGNYGVPGESTYYYDDLPTLKKVQCSIQSSGYKSLVAQGEPGATVEDTLKAYFRKDLQISLNDKVLFKGVTYKAKVPRVIRNHHLEVELVRVVE